MFELVYQMLSPSKSMAPELTGTLYYHMPGHVLQILQTLCIHLTLINGHWVIHQHIHFPGKKTWSPEKNEMTGLVPQILFTVHINLNMSLETQCCSQVFPPWSKTLLVHWVLCSLPVLYLNSYFLKKSGEGGSYILSSRSEQSLLGVQFFPITLSLSRSCLILIDEGLTHVSSFPLCWCKQA